eukprot:scaffold329761_cov19-Prasinocladus_malaysianus.AAC.1
MNGANDDEVTIFIYFMNRNYLHAMTQITWWQASKKTRNSNKFNGILHRVAIANWRDVHTVVCKRVKRPRIRTRTRIVDKS